MEKEFEFKISKLDLQKSFKLEKLALENTFSTSKITFTATEYETYSGNYSITPKLAEEQTLETKNKVLTNNVKVLEIPYFETPTAGTEGKTIYIGMEAI